MAACWRCISVVVLLVAALLQLPAWLSEPVLAPDGLPPAEPAKSALAESHWWRGAEGVTATQRDVEHFEEHGWVVLKQAIPTDVVDIMHAEATRVCTPQLRDSYVCRIKQARFKSDLFRDFLFYSPGAKLARLLLKRDENRPLRVLEDGVFGHKWRWLLQSVSYFSFWPHIDGGGARVYSTFPPETQGVSMWLPLQDLDPETTGGSVDLFSGGVYPKPCSKHLPGCAIVGKQENKTTVSVQRGDVVFWHPLLLHNAKAVLEENFTRYVYFVWLFDADARSCRSIGCDSKIGLPCCKGDPVSAGSYLHHACYPQVGPALPSEMEESLKGSMVDAEASRSNGPDTAC